MRRSTQIVGQGDEVTTGQIPFTPRAKKVLELSLREALSLGHNYIGTEHILLGLIRENEGSPRGSCSSSTSMPRRSANVVIQMLSGGPAGGDHAGTTARRSDRGCPTVGNCPDSGATGSSGRRRCRFGASGPPRRASGAEGWQLVSGDPRRRRHETSIFQRPAGRWESEADVL